MAEPIRAGELRDVPEQLAGLTVALRAAGVRVGPAETADATRVLTLVSWAERGIVRASLGAALAKSAADRRVFEQVFDRYFFGATEEQARAAGEPASLDAQPAPDAPNAVRVAPATLAEEWAELRAQLLALLEARDEGALADLAVLAARQVPFAGTSALVGAGAAVARFRGQLQLSEIVREWQRELRDGDLSMEEDLALRERLRLLTAFEAAMRRELERRRARETGRPSPPGRALGAPHLEELSFSAATAAELRELGRAVQPLARALASRLERSAAHGRRSPRPDMRRTIRLSLETGGVPIRVAYERRPPSKPALAILADVSSSVAASTAFTIQLVYALQERFRRVRTFAFVECTDEVTGLFGAGVDLREAVREMNRTAKVVDDTGRSNYGRSLAELEERYGDAVDSRTTLIVVGDARTNWHEPRDDVLAGLAARARRAYWLNPELRTSWDTGDSVMRRYVPHLTGAFSVRNLRGLQAFVRAVH